MNNPVYLDYAATAPFCEEAACAMAPFFEPGPENILVNANANSLHVPGRTAFSALENARKELASVIGAKPNEVIFTSGATESDNMALFGIAIAETQRRRQEKQGSFVPRIVTSAIEHPAVRRAAKQLGREGFEVVYVQPGRSGIIDPDVFSEALSDNTVLASIQWANSETGAIQPITELAHRSHKAGALFHADATQAFGKIPIDLADSLIDAASFSAHKIGGPKGTGALYLKMRTPFNTRMFGGGQEVGKRSGTQNVAGAVGFAAAARAAAKMQAEETARLAALRDELYLKLSELPQVVQTVSIAPGSTEYLPNIVHVMVRGFESETLVLRLGNAGFCVSGGSACSSGSLEPSRTLTSMGVPRDLALGALRVSMGRYTCKSDIESFIEVFPSVLV